MERARPQGTECAEIVSVIRTVSMLGSGLSDDDPCRYVEQYWSLDGELLATKDPFEDRKKEQQKLLKN